ncbi:hypothetical protein Ddye_009955 [Dipteronia dyeriana]|uniref:Vitamin K epoxide reductase domain-containing protein n=1 Tax=Dipteronia dyeriana TaxID=168575 RepID=A0AAD9XDD6_9ROSI|nr:hypothetical protein Ddye_009955 [Dipteronia dyeriana]
MASFIAISSSSSSSPFLSPGSASLSPLPPPPRSITLLSQVKCWGARVVVLPVKCSTSGQNHDAESEPETTTTTSSSAFSSSSISTYNWCAGIGGVGFLETAYLTYLKLSNTDAFCPVGGGSCGDVLNSDYAVVFGVPLPLIGMVAYGLVATLGLQLARKSLPFQIDESYSRLILLGSTTSIAAASAYFLYILSTKFPGTSCAYCLISAVLSFSLFFITLKEFGFEEIQKEVGIQIIVTGLVIATLSTSYSSSQPVSSAAEVNLPFFETEITAPSSPFTLSLAKHLHAIGAKMYGAFWCSHCLEQKQAFGEEAAKQLDYVECFPNGYRKGTKIAKACADAKIEGFPTWVINGQVLSGEQELEDLALASRFSEVGQPS